MVGSFLLASSLLGAIDEERLAAALVGRGEPTDKAWEQIVPLLPENGRRCQQWRGIATRYEKRAVNYRAAVVIAALMIWLAS
jgi:hypothetical protein